MGIHQIQGKGGVFLRGLMGAFRDQRRNNGTPEHEPSRSRYNDHGQQQRGFLQGAPTAAPRFTRDTQPRRNEILSTHAGRQAYMTNPTASIEEKTNETPSSSSSAIHRRRWNEKFVFHPPQSLTRALIGVKQASREQYASCRVHTPRHTRTFDGLYLRVAEPLQHGLFQVILQLFGKIVPAEKLTFRKKGRGAVDEEMAKKMHARAAIVDTRDERRTRDGCGWVAGQSIDMAFFSFYRCQEAG